MAVPVACRRFQAKDQTWATADLAEKGKGKKKTLKRDDNKCFGEDVVGTVLVGMQYGAATLKNHQVVPQRLNIEIPYDPAIPLLGVE